VTFCHFTMVNRCIAVEKERLRWEDRQCSPRGSLSISLATRHCRTQETPHPFHPGAILAQVPPSHTRTSVRETTPHSRQDPRRSKLPPLAAYTEAQHPIHVVRLLRRLFYFYIFRKHFLQKYIFNITFYSFVPLPPGRGAAGGLPPSSGAVGTYM